MEFKVGTINTNLQEFEKINQNLTLKELNKINKIDDFDYIFMKENDILYLKNCNSNLPAICCNFEDKSLLYRLETSGKNQDLEKACGINKNTKTIIDTTAGMGKDSFILASYDVKIIMIEKNKLIYYLLKDGIERAINSNNQKIKNICKNMTLYNSNSIDFLQNFYEKVDCIYLDPMFTKENGKSLVKKEMQIFHNLAFYGDNEKLFKIAIQKANNRVIVKRMLDSPLLINMQPSYQIKGKTVRYDIYLTK